MRLWPRRREDAGTAARRADDAGGRGARSQAAWAHAVGEWVEAAAPLREAWQGPQGRWLLEVWEWSLWSRGGWAWRDGPLPPGEVAAALAERLAERLPHDSYAALVAVDLRVLALTAPAHLPELDVAERGRRLREAARLALPGLPAPPDASRGERAAGAATWRRVDESLQSAGLAKLDVVATLGQARWWPGRAVDELPPYRRPDPLGLAVGRRLSETRAERAEEWHPLLGEAAGAAATPVDPVPWLLGSLSYAARLHGGDVGGDARG